MFSQLSFGFWGCGSPEHFLSPDFLLFSSDPAFGKRNFEPMLTVELCGTAGRTGFEFFSFEKISSRRGLIYPEFSLESSVPAHPAKAGHPHPLHTANSGDSRVLPHLSTMSSPGECIWGGRSCSGGPCMSQEGRESPLVPAGIKASFLFPQVPLDEAVGAEGAAQHWGGGRADSCPFFGGFRSHTTHHSAV